MRLDRVSACRHVVLALLLALLTAGCMLGTSARTVLPEPTAAPVERLSSTRPLVALALGSGGARGFAHIGVIKALEAAGVPVDIVVGSSSGAIVAALYAAGHTGAQLEAIASGVDQSDLLDISFAGGVRVRGERLAEFVTASVGYRPIERLPRPFAVVATDAQTGAAVAFNRGDPGLAVRASSSVPRLFVPPVIGDREYIDGGLSSPVPVELARRMGADIVIAVDVSRLGQGESAGNGAGNGSVAAPRSDTTWPMVSRASRLALLERELAQASVVIRPRVQRTRLLDFDRKQESIDAGAAAAHASLPALWAAMDAAARKNEARSRLY